MTSKNIESVSNVPFTTPHAILGIGLTYYYTSRRCGRLDVLRFDTAEKLDAFCVLFGSPAGFGVRKRCPRYCDEKALLCYNDIVKMIACPPLKEVQATGGSNHQQQEEQEGRLGFTRFGIAQDGVDLSYDADEGVLQIVLRYSKCVVNADLLQRLVNVGLVMEPPLAQQKRVALSSELVVSTEQDNEHDASSDDENLIAPGMEFIDKDFVMQITDVQRSTIYASRKLYQIDNVTKRMSNVIRGSPYFNMVVVYTDFADISTRIQAMLE